MHVSEEILDQRGVGSPISTLACQKPDRVFHADARHAGRVGDGQD